MLVVFETVRPACMVRAAYVALTGNLTGKSGEPQVAEGDGERTVAPPSTLKFDQCCKFIIWKDTHFPPIWDTRMGGTT